MKKPNLEYCIVEESLFVGFKNRIKKHIACGWIPQGGISSIIKPPGSVDQPGTCYIQAMTRIERSPGIKFLPVSTWFVFLACLIFFSKHYAIPFWLPTLNTLSGMAFGLAIRQFIAEIKNRSSAGLVLTESFIKLVTIVLFLIADFFMYSNRIGS